MFEPGYALSPSRGYNPPTSTLADLTHLHATLGIDRVVFTQPSVYGKARSRVSADFGVFGAATPIKGRISRYAACWSPDWAN